MIFNLELFKQHLQDAEVIMFKNEIRGSLTYLQYGMEVRNKIYSLAMDMLRDDEFKEIKLSDIIRKSDVVKLDSISLISENYFSIIENNFNMAAGHEIPFYLFLKKYLKLFRPVVFPIKFFNFGSVFRFPKKTKFPFNLGERRSFLECFIVYKNEKSKEKYINWAVEWNRQLIKEKLHLPSIEVERPLITNKSFSRKTICIDSLTPIGISVITGMSYFHDDIFTKLLEIKYKHNLTGKSKLFHAMHFGISDNLFFSYLINCHDGRGFRMLNNIAPLHIEIIISDDVKPKPFELELITKYLDEKKYRYNVEYAKKLQKPRFYIKKNIINGTPLTIIFSHYNSSSMTLFYRGDFATQEFKINDLYLIDDFLKKNDEEIICHFKIIEAETIVECDTIEDVNRSLLDGKVCKIYLKNNDNNIQNWNQKLLLVHVLGFCISKNSGYDILTGDSGFTLAYISKRS